MIEFLKILRHILITVKFEEQPDISNLLKSLHSVLQLLFNQCDEEFLDIMHILIESLSVCVSISVELSKENYIFQNTFITSLCDSSILKNDSNNQIIKQQVTTLAIFDILAQHPMLIFSATHVIIDTIKLKFFQFEWPISYVLYYNGQNKRNLYKLVSPFIESTKLILEMGFPKIVFKKKQI